MGFMPIEGHVLDSAALVEPLSLRTLDSIHLATALSLGDELDELITYDQRMIQAAEAVAMTVVSPS